MKIIECVPNFSEGRNGAFLDEMVHLLSDVGDVRVLDAGMDPDHNRSVITFIGTCDSILTGADRLCDRAVELIDMRTHEGVHPRMGAVDVVPFIPLAGAGMEDAVAAAHTFGRGFARRNRIPVYFYGAAALHPRKKELPDVRRCRYEGLEERLKDEQWKPDAGPARHNPRSGATAVGARKPLIAFNVNLNCDNVVAARQIARDIRESYGGLPCVRAIGIELTSRGIVQVSMNLIDYEVTPPVVVFDHIREQAAQWGIEVLESELIGLAPQKAFEGISADYLKLVNFGPERILENYLSFSPKSFDSKEK